MAAPPPIVRDICEHLLDELDSALPGLVVGFFLTGSAVLGDWRAGRSDIDFIGATARPASPEEAEQLRRVAAAASRGLGGQKIDGHWLADLSAPPPPGVDVAVALRTLALHGAAIRGAIPSDIWCDPGAVRAALLANLDDYWAPWLRAARRPLTSRGLAMLGGWAPAWGVLGLARIAYTLRTDDIASKAAAGRWAMAEFTGHWAAIGEALRLRAGGGAPVYPHPFARRREMLAAMDALLASCRGLR